MQGSYLNDMGFRFIHTLLLLIHTTLEIHRSKNALDPYINKYITCDGSRVPPITSSSWVRVKVASYPAATRRSPAVHHRAVRRRLQSCPWYIHAVRGVQSCHPLRSQWSEEDFQAEERVEFEGGERSCGISGRQGGSCRC